MGSHFIAGTFKAIRTGFLTHVQFDLILNLVFKTGFDFTGADMNVRDYSGHKPIHYLKATAGSFNKKLIPYDKNVPLWKRNYFSATNYAVQISQETRDRLSGKVVIGRKSNENRPESGDGREHVKRGSLVDNIASSGRKNSLDSNSVKNKKVSRKETKIKAVKRKPTFLRSKSTESSEHPPPTPAPPSAMPPPAPRRPVSATSGMMWKPVGPKS